MIYVEKYTGTKTYMFPNGMLATPEAMLAQFPAIATFDHIIETDAAGEVCYAVENLSAMRTLHGIETTLSEVAAIIAIQTALNAPPPEPEATAEERIAAALEYQVISSMPDATEV